VVHFGDSLLQLMTQYADKEPVGEVETALLDAELFIKYGSPDRAMKTPEDRAGTQPAIDRAAGTDA
jgi:hypothetical protein